MSLLSTKQDGALLTFTTRNQSFVGAAVQLVLDSGGEMSSRGEHIVRHFGARLVFSGSVSGVFFGRLQDMEFPQVPGRSPATALRGSSSLGATASFCLP